MFDLFLPQTPLRTLRLCEIIFVFFSRKGAKAAKNFDVYLVLILNTFACFAPWREYICFYLSQRRQGRRELLCLICSYPKHLCELCASARLYLFFSLAKAPRPPRTSMFIWFLSSNTFACFAPWREYIYFYLSQRRRGRRELLCSICCYPKTFACFAPWREYMYFFLSISL